MLVFHVFEVGAEEFSVGGFVFVEECSFEVWGVASVEVLEAFDVGVSLAFSDDEWWVSSVY